MNVNEKEKKKTGRKLALKYFPKVYFDKEEPFDVKLIGYHIYRVSQESLTFDRKVWVDPLKVRYVIEYAIYFDYDIEHMYDLEHIWIYVGFDGKVTDAECSSHGRYVNCWRLHPEAEDGEKITLYSQPGKHAFYPEGRLFLLFPDYEEVCMNKAGAAGLLVPPFLEKILHTNEALDAKIQSFMQRKYSFKPTLEFEEGKIKNKIFVPEEELPGLIAERVKGMVKELG